MTKSVGCFLQEREIAKGQNGESIKLTRLRNLNVRRDDGSAPFLAPEVDDLNIAADVTG